MKYSNNLPDVVKGLSLGMNLSKAQQDELARLQAFSLMAVMKDRIHVQGKDSDGNPIGTYTPAYIKYVRMKKKRGADNKVILSLTRQMESGYQLEAIENGYTICFRTAEDIQKSKWCEETYGKAIFKPTAEEKALIVQIAQEYVQQLV
jgi:hypothetical protein